MKEKTKICCVLVTYGNRFHLIRQVLDVLLNMKINKIIIVDNNSSQDSRKALKNYAQKREILKIISLKKNTGSASGYKTGIEAALKSSGSDFIWLLDDDNCPDSNALEMLIQVWEKLDNGDKEENVCLVSFRENRDNYRKAVLYNRPDMIPGRKNIFRAFHIIDVLDKLFGKVFHKDEKIFIDKKLGEIHAAPYGGMYFHKKLIDVIGYPDENYYLYVDDHEFSHRIIKRGGKIFLVLGSIVHDIDESWHNQDKGFAFSKIARDNNYFRLYYSVRNRAYFEKNVLVDNWLLYVLHAMIYSLLVLLTALWFCRFKNIKIYFTALFDGFTGRVGINNKYTLQ